MTHQYELMVILDPEIDERTVAPSLDKFLNVIRNDGGTIDNIDIWGRRRLAYEIQKKSEGIYAVVNFTATSDATVELDRQLKLSEAVLRTKVLRAEEAVARATAVHAEDEKRAARKAGPAPQSPGQPVAAPGAAPRPPAAARGGRPPGRPPPPQTPRTARPAPPRPRPSPPPPGPAPRPAPGARPPRAAPRARGAEGPPGPTAESAAAEPAATE